MRLSKGIIAVAFVFVSITLSCACSWAGINDDLYKAAIYGDVEAVKSCLAKGADVNAKDKAGGTALMVAINNNHADVVRLLVDKGADVNAKDKDGWTALMVASYKSHPDFVRLLIDKGADVNAKSSDGNTALTLDMSHMDIEKMLKAAGAKEDEAK
ncbi:MAG: ankyrin repeat domain-containing protein [Nitrospirota bacterium]